MAVARASIESHLVGRGYEPGFLAGEAAGVFVTLRKLDGALRGCIGSVEPRTTDIVQETARSAVLAATRDPRFSPLQVGDLGELCIEVSVLTSGEPVSELSDLDPTKYGVIVRDTFGRQGLLLPDIPGVATPKQQVSIARSKAGIDPDAEITLLRFTVRKYSEEQPGLPA